MIIKLGNKFFSLLICCLAFSVFAAPERSRRSQKRFKSNCEQILHASADKSHHQKNALTKDRARRNVHVDSGKSSRVHRALAQPLWSPDLWGDKKHVRILTMNMYNIFEHLGRELSLTDGFLKKPLPRRPKNIEKIRKKAQVFLDLMPEIAVVQEIELGRDFSAKQNLVLFAKEALEDRYEAFVSPHTNDNKTAIGFLVKKELLNDYEFTVVSHAHHRSSFVNPHKGEGDKVFARDFPVLMMRKKGDPDPMLAVFGAHLKSKRLKLTMSDRALEGTPAQWRSAEKRVLYKYRMEINEIIKIIRNFRSFHPYTPYLISGDFNRELSTTAELQQLKRALKVKESITTVYPKSTLEQRTTAFYFDGGNKRYLRQLDANLVSSHLVSHVKDSWVYRYRDDNGYELPMPKTYEERESVLPSDHYPVVVDIYTRAWNKKLH